MSPAVLVGIKWDVHLVIITPFYKHFLQKYWVVQDCKCSIQAPPCHGDKSHPIHSETTAGHLKILSWWRSLNGSLWSIKYTCFLLYFFLECTAPWQRLAATTICVLNRSNWFELGFISWSKPKHWEPMMKIWSSHLHHFIWYNGWLCPNPH